MSLTVLAALQLVFLRAASFTTPLSVGVCNGAVLLSDFGTISCPHADEALTLLTCVCLGMGCVTDMITLRNWRAMRMNRLVRDTCTQLLLGTVRISLLFICVFGVLEVINFSVPDPAPTVNQQLSEAAIAALAANNFTYAPEFGACSTNISVLVFGSVPAACAPWCAPDAPLCSLPIDFATPNAFIHSSYGAAYATALAALCMTAFVFAFAPCARL